MPAFLFHDGQLHCEMVPLSTIAAEVGTPAYVYSRSELARRANSYTSAVPPTGLVCFAVKSNGNPALIRLLGEAGLGADVTSGGELFLALWAGIAADKIIFSGVGKTPTEIEAALTAGVRAIHVESEMEMDVISATAARLDTLARIGVRLNPNIRTETHPYISTGLQSHKFGVPPERALRMMRQAAVVPYLQPVSVAAHIGSQITDVAPFRESAEFLAAFAQELASAGVAIEYLDVGGGLGIDYGEGATIPGIERWVATVVEPVARAGYQVVLEPGRSLVGPAGILLTQVVYTKEQGEKRFLIADAAMNDLLRPTLYQAHHPITPVRQAAVEAEMVAYDVVGPICESGDWLAKDRLLPAVRPGDLLAVEQAGAYGFAMSSNYNGRLRPPELLVDGSAYHVIRRRQSYAHLLDGCR